MNKKLNGKIEDLIAEFKDLLKSDDDFKIIENMEKYGGSFVKSLAVCLQKADSVNYLKLKRTFINYFLEYEKFNK